MVSPIYLIAIPLLVAFLLGIADRLGRGLSMGLTLGSLAWMLGLSGSWFVALLGGGAGVEVLTAGFEPPFAINLRMGLLEAGLATVVNLAFLGSGIVLAGRFLREHIGAQVLLLMMAMGSTGLILTRDLFNVFVFLEITAIATYGMIALQDDERGLAAGFKYVIAGGLSSAFFLLGTIYLYRLTGTLNIDGMIAASGSGALLATGAGFTALFMVVMALIVELKPFPANGWALDVYEGADPSVAAVISVGTSGGIFAALYKLMPMLPEALLGVLAGLGVVTFGLSNLMGLRQKDARRMLGYSSVAQIGLVVAAVSFARLQGWSAATTLLVAGGVLVNHLLAKGGLFWLAGITGFASLARLAEKLQGRRGLLILAGVFVVALAGLPPFPTFWAKWALISELMSSGQILWVIVILTGSLFEATYVFRFLGAAVTPAVLGTTAEAAAAPGAGRNGVATLAPGLFGLLLLLLGVVSAWLFGFRETLLFVPMLAAPALWLLDWLPAKLKGLIAAAGALFYGWQIYPLLGGIGVAFLAIFALGGAVVLLALLNRRGRARGVLPLAATLVLSMTALLAAESSLAFFLAFELITLSSYLLLLRRPVAARAALRYLVFSLGGAFLLMLGLIVLAGAAVSFTMPHLSAAPTLPAPGELLGGASAALLGGLSVFSAPSVAGIGAGGALAAAGSAALPIGALILIALGFLAKAGAAGLHIWLPGAYAEAEDDISPLFSGILSKVPVVGIFMVVVVIFAAGTGTAGGAAAGSGTAAGGLLLSILGWIGALTALFGALLAVFQQDVKYLLAYSSMSQLGYIFMAFVMGTQLGWTTGLYLSMLHLTFKGMLFLAVAGVVLRTGTRAMHEMGGLIKRMPITFIVALMAIIATSGVPPLAGFGGKWMLYTALIERGWYFQGALAFFASTIAFLYLFKFIHTIFLGQMKLVHRELREAPIWLLIPQIILGLGLMTVSMYPNLLIDPLLGATGETLAGLGATAGLAGAGLAGGGAGASTTAMEGYTVISTLGYWNGNLVMYVTMAVFMLPLVWLLVVMRRPQRVGQFNIVYAGERPDRPETTHYAHNFFSHYHKALGFLTAPGVIAFWNGVREAVASLGSALRRVYSGNGQTYALHIVLLLVVLYLIAGGLA